MSEPSGAPDTDLAGKRVLVTGGAGFIGSHLVRGLLDAGAVVRILDDLSTGNRKNLIGSEAAELVLGDIRDLATCERACDGIEVVYHEAAICSVPRSMDDPATTIAINVGGTANVFAAARTAKVGRIVFASSSSVFGDCASLPQCEGDEGTVQSIYAMTKSMDEDLADTYARAFGMNIVGLRYFNVFGPRQDPNGPYAAVVPRFFDAYRTGQAPTIFGDGSQTRDFIDVRDVVRANLLAGAAAHGGAVAINIASGIPTTIGTLARAIGRLCGHPGLEPVLGPARTGDIRHSVAGTDRAVKLLGFRAERALEDGLAHINACAG